MKIGILETGHAPDVLRPQSGDYADMFARFLAGHGFSFSNYDVENMQFPANIHAADGWLITGSRHGVYEDHPFIAPLEEFIRDAYAADIPMVGVCFGHQMIAQALGGKVEKFRDGWAVGRQTYQWQDEALALNAWHQDQVVDVPKDAQPLASSDFCENAALVYGKRAFTVQPHPEFESDFIAGLSEHRAPGIVPDDLLSAAKAQLNEPNDNARLANMVARFFKERVVA